MQKNIPLGATLGVALSMLFVVLATFFSPLHLSFNKNITLPLDFWVRQWLDKNPPVSPQLKIYAFDDLTLQYLDKPDLSLVEWGQLLKAMAAARPKAIYIDKIFGTVDKEGREEFRQLLIESKVPVVASGFVQAAVTRTDSVVDVQRPEFDPCKTPNCRYDWLWLPLKKGFFYGPHHSIQSAFSAIGHIMYADDGKIRPLVMIDSKHLIPHISISLEAYALEAKHLKVSGKSVALDAQGALTANLLPTGVLAGQIISLKSAISRAREGGSFTSVIKEGQIVLILPGMYTGNSDRVQTPIGNFPGGYVIAAMLNSLLTGEWLSAGPNDFIVCLSALLLAVAITTLLPPAWWLLAVIAITLSMSAWGVVLFCFYNTTTVWPLAVTFFLITVGWLFALCRRQRERQHREDEIRRESMQQAAAAVQEAFFSDKINVKNLHFAAWHQAADSLGGDWYSLYLSPNRRRLFLLIGDVTGHGIASALVVPAVAGAIHATLGSLQEQQLSVAQTLQQLVHRANEVILDTSAQAQKSMTMAFIAIDRDTMSIHLANCGHPPVYLKRGTTVQCLAINGGILGIDRDISFDIHHWPIAPGDIVFALTDGLIENRGRKGDMITKKALIKRLTNAATPGELVTSIQQLIKEKWQGDPLRDDCSFCALSFQDGPWRLDEPGV